MRTLILGGFLGSGKTTVLVQLAKHLVSRCGTDIQAGVVILENEISPNGIDSEILSGEQFTVENLFAGCICCTSSGQLADSIAKIRSQYSPEWLIIEATGLAHPDLIKKALWEDSGIEARILVIVDSKRWPVIVRAFPDFVVSQLSDCALILLNKTDQVTGQQLDAVRESVLSYGVSVPVYPICAMKPIPEKTWAPLVGQE